MVLYGVDWSGAAEARGRNPKIWIASLDRGQVQLRCGRAGFGRRDVAHRIVREAGVWVLDFPFGIPAKIAAAIGLDPSDWPSWLSWVDSGPSPFNPTTLRDQARSRVASVPNLCWSSQRAVDESIGTTWFPLFEQLYRQTLTGAHDLLSQLYRTGEVTIAPFMTVTTQTRTLACEGFPGFAIREHLGLDASRYKRATDDAMFRRRGILDALERYLGASLDQVRDAAECDAEGDAVDALVLLAAAQRVCAMPSSEWAAQRQHLADQRLLIEGWFPG